MAGMAQVQSSPHYPLLSQPKSSISARAYPHCHSQVLEVCGPTESFPGDGLNEVLAQVPMGKRSRKENEHCLQDRALHGAAVFTDPRELQPHSHARVMWFHLGWLHVPGTVQHWDLQLQHMEQGTALGKLSVLKYPVSAVITGPAD